jgi:hypothetical protein
MAPRHLLVVLGTLAGCAAASSSGEGQSAATASNIQNQSGKPLDVSKLHDVIAETFLRDASKTPTTYADLVKGILAAQQGLHCEVTSIALVSERAQLLGKPDAFRSVLMRICGDKRVLLSPLETVAAGDPTPTDVEILAFDETRKIFDFYALEGGQLRFMGTSVDMLDGPGSGSGGSQERRCANCHTGGGPVMKELLLPWANWDGPTGLHFNGGTTSPGSDVVFKQLATGLGLPPEATHATGDQLQNVVQDGNTAWNQARRDTLAAKDTRSLLRPLFCTVEVNLQTSPALHQPLQAIGIEALVNSSEFNVFSAPDPQVAASDYTKVVGAHQTVLDEQGHRLNGSDGKPLVDTAFAYNHPFASFADNNYIDLLRKVTSDDFVNAVLGVDFTTPVFSDRRCGLLQLVPTIPVDVAHPAAYAKVLRDGLVSAISSAPHDANSPEADLLANLQNPSRPQARVTSFLKACAARGTADSGRLTLELMRVQSVQRRHFRALPIFEHRELLPEDDFGTPDGARLDPVDCTLK